MALIEAPSIVIGVLLISLSTKENTDKPPLGKALKHSVTNGSELLIIGCLVKGYLASDAPAYRIKPSTPDIFKGFLAVFLLDIGITSGKELSTFMKKGWFALIFAIAVPVINGCAVAVFSGTFTERLGNRCSSRFWRQVPLL